MRASLVAASAALLLASVGSTAHAQDSASDPQVITRAQTLLSGIAWTNGPAKSHVGDVAEINVPENCRFTGVNGTKLFMEATENPVSGRELGTLLCRIGEDGHFFVLFSYDESGYVKDDEQGTLDRDAILSSLKDGTNEGNGERRRNGWEEIELVGWQLAPFYDPRTHNLTWSTRIRVKGTAKGAEDETINHSIRLLGREGVMHADLVLDPKDLQAALPPFDAMVAGFHYLPGHTYAEWRSGDKIAEYGLTALIAGGAGAAAMKMGLFGKLWKLILTVLLALKKLIVVALVALGGFFKRLFGKGDDGGTPKPKKGEAKLVDVKRVVAVPQDPAAQASDRTNDMPSAGQAQLPPPLPGERSATGGGSQGPVGPMGR